MIERVLLVAWKGSSATQWVDALQAGGYTVLLEDTTGERAWRTAKERGIDVVIIDGQKKPSHGRQTGHALRDTAKTRDIPIIWTNLDAEDAASVQAEVKPDLILASPTDATSALAALHSLNGDHAHVHTHDATEAVLSRISAALPPATPAPTPAPHPVAAPVEPEAKASRTATRRPATAARKASAKVAKPAKKVAPAKKPAPAAKKQPAAKARRR